MFAPFRLGAQMPPASLGRKISEGRDRPPTSRRLTPCLGAMNFLPGLSASPGGGWLRDGLDPTLRTESSTPLRAIPAGQAARSEQRCKAGPRLRLSSVVRAGTSPRGQPADPAGPREARRPQAGAELAAQDPRATNSISDCKTQRVRLMIFGQAAARQTVQSRKSVQRFFRRSIPRQARHWHPVSTSGILSEQKRETHPERK